MKNKKLISKNYYIAPSKIQGKGLFANKDFSKGELIGLAHVDGQPTPEIGMFHNHDENTPTAVNIKKGNNRYLVAGGDIKAGTELTTNYRMQPELEQPEDWSEEGYKDDSPYRNEPFIDINDNIEGNGTTIDMSETGKTLSANGRVLPPYSGIHQFDEDVVREIPLAQGGGGLIRGLARNLNPLKYADYLFPKVSPYKLLSFGMPVEGAGFMSGSPLNSIPFYGNDMLSKRQNPGELLDAYRKFGNSLGHVIDNQVLSPQGGMPFRLGKSQIVNEGNWASLGSFDENYSGVFGAKFDFNKPGSNLGYENPSDRNGVLITDRNSNTLKEIPVTDPGLSFHRRLPFSHRYVPIDKQKLLNDEFQFSTVLPHAQSLLEKYGVGFGIAAGAGLLTGSDEPLDIYKKYTSDPVIDYSNKAWDFLNKNFQEGGNSFNPTISPLQMDGPPYETRFTEGLSEDAMNGIIKSKIAYDVMHGNPGAKRLVRKGVGTRENYLDIEKDVKKFADKYVTSDHHRKLLEKYNYPEDKIYWRMQDILNYNPDRDTRFALSGNSYVGGAGEHFPIKEGQQEGQPIVQYNLFNPHPYPIDQVVSHEWGHIPVSSGFNPLSEEERNEYVTRLKPGSVRNAHDAEPQENRADQFELRYFLDKAGIYDSSTGEKFTQKHLDDYREKTGTHHRMFNLYDDEDIIWLMNNIAAVDDGKELNIAQDGGEYEELELTDEEIEEYRRGGHVVEELPKAQTGGSLIKRGLNYLDDLMYPINPIKPSYIPPVSIPYQPFTRSITNNIDFHNAFENSNFALPLVNEIPREGINHTLKLADEIKNLQSILPSIKINNEYDLGQFKKKYLQNKGLKQEDFKILDDYILENDLFGEIQPIDLANSLHNELTFPVTVQKLYEPELDYKTKEKLLKSGDALSKNYNNPPKPASKYKNYSPKEYSKSPNYEYNEYTINTPGIKARGDKHFSHYEEVPALKKNDHVAAGVTTIGHMRGYKNLNDPTHFTVLENQSDVMQGGERGHNIKDVLVHSKTWDDFKKDNKEFVNIEHNRKNNDIRSKTKYIKNADNNTWKKIEQRKNENGKWEDGEVLNDNIHDHEIKYIYENIQKFDRDKVNLIENNLQIDNNKNKFLKLLQGSKNTKPKDKRWLKLQTNAIVQQLVKDGYTTIDFPLGKLASSTQGHRYLSPEEASKQKELYTKNKSKIDELDATVKELSNENDLISDKITNKYRTTTKQSYYIINKLLADEGYTVDELRKKYEVHPDDRSFNQIADFKQYDKDIGEAYNKLRKEYNTFAENPTSLSIDDNIKFKDLHEEFKKEILELKKLEIEGKNVFNKLEEHNLQLENLGGRLKERSSSQINYDGSHRKLLEKEFKPWLTETVDEFGYPILRLKVDTDLINKVNNIKYQKGGQLPKAQFGGSKNLIKKLINKPTKFYNQKFYGSHFDFMNPSTLEYGIGNYYDHPVKLNDYINEGFILDDLLQQGKLDLDATKIDILPEMSNRSRVLANIKDVSGNTISRLPYYTSTGGGGKGEFLDIGSWFGYPGHMAMSPHRPNKEWFIKGTKDDITGGYGNFHNMMQDLIDPMILEQHGVNKYMTGFKHNDDVTNEFYNPLFDGPRFEHDFKTLDKLKKIYTDRGLDLNRPEWKWKKGGELPNFQNGGKTGAAVNALREIIPGVKDYSKIKQLVNPYIMKDVLKDVNLQKGFLGYLGHGAIPFEQYRDLTLRDLSTNEGFSRLHNLELDYLKSINFPQKFLEMQTRMNVAARKEEMEKIKNLNLIAKQNISNPNNQVNILGNESFYNNAFFAPPQNTIIDRFDPIYFKDKYGIASPEDLELIRGSITERFINAPQLGSQAIEGSAGLGQDFVYPFNMPTMAHELRGHGLQRGRVLPIDNDARRMLLPKGTMNPYEKEAYEYFYEGSGGLEPSPFLQELRESMFQDRMIRDRYQTITPDLLKRAQTYYGIRPSGIIRSDGKGFLTDHRILDFMDPTKTNYSNLSHLLNRLPSIATGIGTGVGLLNTDRPEGDFKKGGSISKFQGGGLVKRSADFLNKMSKKYNTRDMINKFYESAPITSIHGSQLRLQDYDQLTNVGFNNMNQLWKPKGLWYGIGNSWRDWAQYEMPEKFHRTTPFSLDLNYGIGPDEILQLNTPESIVEFTNQFKNELIPGNSIMSGIDWNEVANRFGGIELSPYTKSEAFNWTDTWDVDSGAIWNKKAIKDYQRIPGLDQSRPEWDFKDGGNLPKAQDGYEKGRSNYKNKYGWGNIKPNTKNILSETYNSNQKGIEQKFQEMKEKYPSAFKTHNFKPGIFDILEAKRIVSKYDKDEDGELSYDEGIQYNLDEFKKADPDTYKEYIEAKKQFQKNTDISKLNSEKVDVGNYKGKSVYIYEGDFDDAYQHARYDVGENLLSGEAKDIFGWKNPKTGKIEYKHVFSAGEKGEWSGPEKLPYVKGMSKEFLKAHPEFVEQIKEYRNFSDEELKKVIEEQKEGQKKLKEVENFMKDKPEFAQYFKNKKALEDNPDLFNEEEKYEINQQNQEVFEKALNEQRSNVLSPIKRKELLKEAEDAYNDPSNMDYVEETYNPLASQEQPLGMSETTQSGLTPYVGGVSYHTTPDPNEVVTMEDAIDLGSNDWNDYSNYFTTDQIDDLTYDPYAEYDYSAHKVDDFEQQLLDQNNKSFSETPLENKIIFDYYKQNLLSEDFNAVMNNKKDELTSQAVNFLTKENKKLFKSIHDKRDEIDNASTWDKISWAVSDPISNLAGWSVDPAYRNMSFEQRYKHDKIMQNLGKSNDLKTGIGAVASWTLPGLRLLPQAEYLINHAAPSAYDLVTDDIPGLISDAYNSFDPNLNIDFSSGLIPKISGSLLNDDYENLRNKRSYENFLEGKNSMSANLLNATLGSIGLNRYIKPFRKSLLGPKNTINYLKPRGKFVQNLSPGKGEFYQPGQYMKPKELSAFSLRPDISNKGMYFKFPGNRFVLKGRQPMNHYEQMYPTWGNKYFGGFKYGPASSKWDPTILDPNKYKQLNQQNIINLKDGGEYELTDQEIENLKQQGYEIEYM